MFGQEGGAGASERVRIFGIDCGGDRFRGRGGRLADSDSAAQKAPPTKDTSE